MFLHIVDNLCLQNYVYEVYYFIFIELLFVFNKFFKQKPCLWCVFVLALLIAMHNTIDTQQRWNKKIIINLKKIILSFSFFLNIIY